MLRFLSIASLLFASNSAIANEPKYSVKVEDKEPPKELSDAVRGSLESKAMNVLADDKVLCTVWAVKSLDSKATPDQAKAGLKYAHLEETSIVAAVQIADFWRDYRKQKIKAGVYTLRIAIQPADGDHMGTAPFNEFALLSPAANDKTTSTMEVKELFELSAKTIGRKHPAMMLLFPNKKPADAPVFESKPKDHWVLSFKVPTTAENEKTTLGFSLVIVGETMAE
jgi:hypothetical protein